MFSNIIPIGKIRLTVDCSDQPDRVIDYNANEGAFDFKWDRRCGDGNLAPSGSYTVVLEACDIYKNCDEARGTVDIPFVALLVAPPTATPIPTIEETEVEQVWYNTPTPVPSFTPTPQEAVLPVLPATGGNDSGDGNIPTGSDQPLLPLTAAALGTSILLAASSKREEREAQAAARLEEMQKLSAEDQAANLAAREASVAAQTVATTNQETPYAEVSTLAALAGVVNETFTGVWEDAIRISPADAPTVHIYTNWVNGVDPIAYYEENAERLAAKAKFWNDYWIASQKKYIEQLRIEAKEANAYLASLENNGNSGMSGPTDPAIIAMIADEERRKAENIAAAAEKAAQANSKLTAVENKTVDRNVYTPPSYSELTKAFNEKEQNDVWEKQQEDLKAFHEKEGNAQNEIDAYNQKKWEETQNKFVVSTTLPGSADAYNYSGKSVFTPDEDLQDLINENIAKQVAGKPTMKDILVNFLNSASAFAGKVYEEARKPAEIKNYQENYGPVSASFGGAPGSYEITYDGSNPFGGYTIEQVKSEYNTEMSDAAAEFILSMIPIIGDGSGIIKEFYNLLMTGEMDKLNFTLSVIGLAMDLPFDGGILGDTAVATLKAASTMIPSGPAREVLLEALQQVGKNPEGLIVMAGAFGKMAGKDDLLKIITSNPEVFKAYLNGGSEFAENLLKHEDEIIQAGKAIGADELIDIMEGGKAAIKSADEVVEAGVKAAANSTDEVVEASVKAAANNTDEVVDAGAKVLVDSDVLYNYDVIRAYNGVDTAQIPIEYRADPNLMTEMEFKGKVMSGTNSAGWERDASKHFEYLLDNHPEFWSDANITRIENGVVPIVDDTFIKSFPQYKNQIGDKLIHHHIGGGGQAVSIPESLHQGFGGVHNVEKELGITGNDPLTDIGQSFVDQLQ